MLNILKKYRLEVVSFTVGLVILAFELAAARVVAPYIGTTIYTWTSIIGVILAALAVGYWYGGYVADTRKKQQDVVLLILAAAGLIFVINLVKDWVLSQISHTELPLRAQAFFGSLFLFAPPTIALGAVSPYLARLSLTGLGTSGHHIARIGAAGTAGSLVGTFLTGYLLFGFIGSRNILNILVILLVINSFILSTRKLLIPRILLLLAAFFGLFSPVGLRLAGVISDVDSRYQRIVIRNIEYIGRPARILQTDSLGWQSGIYLDKKDELVFPYIRAFGYAAATKKAATDYLIIGGGAFTLPAYLATTNTRSQVDVVEIDDAMPQISQKYFNYKPLDNLKIIAADGRQFLNQNSKKYDFVFIDAFTALTPPFQLLTIEAAQKQSFALKPSGVVAANIISAQSGSKSEMIKSVYNTYRQVFKHISVLQVIGGTDPHQRQNLLLLASDYPLDLKILQAGTQIPEAKRLFGSPIIIEDSSLILTDDFAPVERLAANGT